MSGCPAAAYFFVSPFFGASVFGVSATGFFTDDHRIAGGEVADDNVLATLADLRLRIDCERPLGILAALGLAGDDEARVGGRLYGATGALNGRLLRF